MLLPIRGSVAGGVVLRRRPPAECRPWIRERSRPGRDRRRPDTGCVNARRWIPTTARAAATESMHGCLVMNGQVKARRDWPLPAVRVPGLFRQSIRTKAHFGCCAGTDDCRMTAQHSPGPGISLAKPLTTAGALPRRHNSPHHPCSWLTTASSLLAVGKGAMNPSPESGNAVTSVNLAFFYSWSWPTIDLVSAARAEGCSSL